MMSLQFDASPDELGVFLEEAEEQLQLLDQDILILEKGGPTAELLQEVFRAAHTLKGSSATIGHERMAALTHAVESILDCLRKGKLESTTALIDLLLQSLDSLRVLKEEVVSLEHSGLDPSSLVSSLKQFLEDNLPANVQGSTVAETPAAEPTSKPDATGSHDNSHWIVVQVDKESPFPAARFLQVHMVLSTIGTIVESTPTLADIELEKVGRELRLTCVTEESMETARELILAVPDIVAVELHDSRPGDASPVVDQESAEDHQRMCGLRDNVRNENGIDGRPEKNTPASDGTRDRLSREASPKDRSTANRNPQGASKTVRIDIERLDALMNLVGELVIDCTRLEQLSSRLQSNREGEVVVEEIAEASLHIQRITDELQDRIMKARMFPIGSVFNRFPRMVRDLAQRAGKKIEFIMEGEETELDRSVIEEIGDPLIHLLRNAVDHGLEPPEERVAAGKSEVGLIRLAASHRENRIVLTVEDDGKGIDPARIRASAVEKGLLSAEAAARMNDREALEIIFAPGFSTAKQISDVSGRGVGMDIVRTNIRKLNGMVTVNSVPGQGSQFVLELPLTLAILNALLVSLDQGIFAIPLSSVVETLRIAESGVKSVNKEKVIQLRGRVLPLLPLDVALGSPRADSKLNGAYVVVVGTDSAQVGIVVDSLVGEQQVVIKSLGNYIGDIKGLSGATILGDGRVGLILDVPALVKMAIQARTGDAVYV
ncbi:MAG: chemotaxis protein CheA [Chloroflexi bacterium]|nr:chemotaxis protein CheA [Chloroflexota bacterium]